MTFFALAGNSIQLVPDGTLVFHVILILVMVYVLNATLFKPINRILAEREKRTAGRSTEAQELLKQVEKKMSDYEHALRNARSEGYRLMEQERSQAMLDRQAFLESINSDMEVMIEKEIASIAQQAKEARRSLQTDAVQIATEISSNILRRPVTSASILSETQV